MISESLALLHWHCCKSNQEKQKLCSLAAAVQRSPTTTSRKVMLSPSLKPLLRGGKEVRVTHLPIKQLFSLPSCIFDVSWSWHLSSSDDLATRILLSQITRPKALDAAMPRLTLGNENCAIVDGQLHFITVNLLSRFKPPGGRRRMFVRLRFSPILQMKCKNGSTFGQVNNHLLVSPSQPSIKIVSIILLTWRSTLFPMPFAVRKLWSVESFCLCFAWQKLTKWVDWRRMGSSA